MTQSKQERSTAHTEQTERNNSTRGQSKTTVAQSIVICSVGGAMEVFVDHPLWSIRLAYSAARRLPSIHFYCIVECCLMQQVWHPLQLSKWA